MTKLEFVENLRSRLSGLPEKEVEDRINFYVEMIDDRIEDGISEEEAVSAIGSIEEITSQIIADIPFAKIAKEKIKPKRKMKAWEIVLLAVGSPLWLALLLTAFAVVLTVVICVYALIWVVDISLWAVFGSLVGCAFGGIVTGILFAVTGNVFSGIALIGASIVCAGLSIFMFFACKAITKVSWRISKKIALITKKCFIKKEEA